MYSHVDQQGRINLDDRELASTRTNARSTIGALVSQRITCDESCGGQGRDRTVDLSIFSLAFSGNHAQLTLFGR